MIHELATVKDTECQLTRTQYKVFEKHVRHTSRTKKGCIGRSTAAREHKAEKLCARDEAEHREMLRKKLRTRMRDLKNSERGVQLQGSIGEVFSLNVDPKARDFLEDIALFTLQLTTKDIPVILAGSYALLKKWCKEKFDQAKDVIFKLIGAAKGFFVRQSGEDKFDPFDVNIGDTGFLKQWSNFNRSPFLAKIVEVFVHLSSFCLHGFSITQANIKNVMKNNVLSSVINTSSFLQTIVSGVKFVCTRLWQAYATGDLSALFHSSDSYEQWMHDAQDALVDAGFLSDKDTKIDRHEWLMRCKRLCEEGDSIVSACKPFKQHFKTTNIVRALVAKIREKMQLETLRKANASARPLPYAMFIVGSTSVGKSTFGRVGFNHFARVRGKSADQQYIYYPDPDSKYMDGYESHQFAFWIDDAACKNPKHVLGTDQSVSDFIKYINIVPTLAHCADLADKGKHPVAPELVIVTSNVPHLNLDQYFVVPAAPARRLPLRFTIEVKEAYRKPGTTFLDGTKCVPEHGKYPNYWRISVARMKVVEGMTEQLKYAEGFKYENVCVFEDIDKFLSFLTDDIREHFSVQDNVKISSAMLADIPYCPGCCVPKNQCSCVDGFCHKCGLLSASCVCLSLQGGFGVYEYVHAQVKRCDVSSNFYTWSDSTKKLVLALYNSTTYIFSHAGLMCFGPGLLATFLFLLLNTIFHPFVTFWLLAPILGLSASTTNRAVVCEVFTTMYLSAVARSMVQRLRMAGRDVFFSLGGTAFLTAVISALPILMTIIILMRRSMSDSTVEQGGVVSMGVTLPSLGEPESVWKRDSFPVDTFEIPRSALSLCGRNVSDIARIMQRHVVALRVRIGDSNRAETAVGTLVGGQEILTVNHFFKHESNGQMKVVFQPHVEGITSNLEARVEKEPTRSDGDIRIMRIIEMQPRKRFPYVSRRSLRTYVGPALLVIRSSRGVPDHISIARISWSPMLSGQHNSAIWVCEGASRETVAGESGSPLFALTPSGPVLVGIHQGVRGANLIALDVSGKSIVEPQTFCEGEPKFTSSISKVGELGDIHAKSPILYRQSGTARVFGSFDGFRSENRSRVIKTPLCEFLDRDGFACGYGAPVMKGYEVKHNALAPLLSTRPVFDADVVGRISAWMVRKWSGGLTPHQKAQVVLLDLKSTINGIDGLRFVDSLNAGTSAGFPHKCPKKCFIENLDVPGERMLNDEMTERVNRILDCYARGETSVSVFSGSLKDEARKLQKIEDKKTRAFMCGSMDLLIVTRMAFLPLVRIIQNNHFVFEQAPGLECQSAEWHHLGEFLTSRSGGRNNIAGDYAAFDASMSPVVMQAVFDAMKNFALECGIDREHAQIMEGIKFDICFPVIDFFGDLLQLGGVNPSGQALTVIVNGFVNSIYMRYAFFHLCPHEDVDDAMRDFDEHVALMTYGDDNVMDVTDDVPFFTHTTVSDFLGKMGIKYTMADKDAVSVPYIPFREVTFLKRVWRWDDILERNVAPLDMNSILKSLMYHIPSKYVSEHAQLAQTILSAQEELYWHGREVFDEWQIRLRQYVGDVPGLALYVTFRTWEELTESARERDAAFYTRHVTVLQGGECDFCFYCDKEDCVLRGVADTDDLRLCMVCGRCKFDEFDLPCPSCGKDDTCQLCAMPLGSSPNNLSLCYQCLLIVSRRP